MENQTMSKSKTKIKETLNDFLFKTIENDPAYQLWERDFEVPDYITDNLHPSKTLRPYQIDALKHFVWLYENDKPAAKHVLFNMATGTGKTLVMAACILFLYDKGYRNFIFLVHRDQILKQAERNFTDYKFEKYLFNPRSIRINGKKVGINVTDTPLKSRRNCINFIFTSQQTLVNRLSEPRENSLTSEDFEKHDIVIIADEAHSLNADTKSKSSSDKDERHWETSVLSTLGMRQKNMLLEFTATVDLANENIHKKYEDKLIFRYDFLAFNKDGYSKDVKFLYNPETQIKDQKRLLIINAVALSEYRRLLAEKMMNAIINPVVLIKSTKIAESEKDRKFFDDVISSLRPEDLNELKAIATQNKNHEHEILNDMFNWLNSDESGLRRQGDYDGLKSFTNLIRVNFAHENTLIYNSQKKEKADLLPQLDSPKNRIRAIFSVNALNEGWDVLSLFDIIHFDISESKKVSLQDIQLIGRGARYCPYELPKKYVKDADNSQLFGRNLQFAPDRRKFDNEPNDKGRALETFFYHFVKTGTFLEKLQEDLLGEGIINQGVERKTIHMKELFLQSDTYKNGFVLVNKTEKRQKTTNQDIDTTFKREIKATSYKLHSASLSDREQNQIIASQRTREIRITDEFFSRPIIRKALVAAENDFFSFENLRNHLIGIQTVDELIDSYLPLYTIKYTYENGKEIENLKAEEKLQLLVGVILPEVRKSIDINMPKVVGSDKFRPVTLTDIFSRQKSIYLASFPTINPVTGEKEFISSDERAKSQTENDNPELQFDVRHAGWYAYDENYGTSEEKRFVKWISTQIDNLRARYPGSEIYVIRNELDYWLFSQDGRRFSPDYLLIINDVVQKQMYYQCIIEPKGGHLLAQDEWKEQTLLVLSEKSEVVFDSEDGDKKSYKEYLVEMQKNGYKEIKNIGLKFFNTDPRPVSEFAMDFDKKLLEKN